MRILALVSLVLTGLLPVCRAESRTLRVVTTSEDLASIVRAVGGDAVSVASLSSGEQDLHLVEPRPSMVMKLKNADVLVKVGMDIDMWVDALISSARNERIFYGAPGYVDASVGVGLLQTPEGKIDGSMGDIHLYGNPHYWLDPVHGKVMARHIAGVLSTLSPERAALFDDRRKRFDAEIDRKLEEWRERLAPLKGTPLVTYHNSWVYFAARFGFEIVGNIEPKPGIPPTPAHLARLVDVMVARGARVILVDPFFPLQGPRAVSERTGARILVVPSSVGGRPGIKTYFDLFDHIVGQLAGA
ncbi:MAG TPA: metal ABC transporter substrate-binding protein [Elusimicrobiota bacterium]|nr:metal ABC transporter substrate-binding protein [Elusimicrobiota bacterium]